MEFRIADTFTSALSRLSRDEQKAVKSSVFDLQTDPTGAKLKPSSSPSRPSRSCKQINPACNGSA
jgi:hypothetical protein